MPHRLSLECPAAPSKRRPGCAASALRRDELSVTHGAVSRHVRSLEDALGLPLLTRSAQGTVPTAEGQRLAEGSRRPSA
jgi:hypothetical protein